MMTKMIIAMALIASPTAFAAATDVWEGPGSLFDVQGKPIGNYSLVVETTKTGKQSQRKVTITLPNGSVHQKKCLTTETSTDGWKSECDHGQGSGHCFGEGLCISYEEDANGNAYATTMIFDGPSDMRLLGTELKNGQAVRFFREKLHKR